MVCQPNVLPLLKFGDYEVVSYEARWLSDEITKAATKAGHEDWFFAGDMNRLRPNVLSFNSGSSE